MTKTLIVAALLSSFAAVSFAQASAPADGVSAPAAKHMKAKKAKKPHRAASAAVNPEASPDKKGGN